MATLAPAVVGPESLPAACAVGGDAVEPELGPRATVLGLEMGDEAASASLSTGWAVFPEGLRRSLADDLFARLGENMDGREDPLEAAMGSLWVLARDASTPYKAADFWLAAPKFVREERKKGLPDWLPILLDRLATAVRERAGQTAVQTITDTRKILSLLRCPRGSRLGGRCSPP